MTRTAQDIIGRSDGVLVKLREGGDKKIMLALHFVVFWLVSSVLTYILGVMAPSGVVLGNQYINPVQASAFFGYMLSTIIILVQPAMELFKVKLGDPKRQAVVYFAVNTIAVWILSRLALMVGVGIAAFWWAGILGLILMLGQWLVGTVLTKR